VKDVITRRYKQKPPVPFNTTDMQSEAYAQFKYSPRQTLSIVETLYQSGAVSYPRSSSQKLPPIIGYKKILEALAKLKPYEALAKELLQKAEKAALVPNEGKQTDPAHPAVYPTFEPPALEKLNSSQKKMYDLIVRRFLAVFADEALRESVTVDLDIEGNKFKVVGKTTIEPGWTKFYGKYLAFEEQQLPELKAGDALGIKGVEMLAKETQPPGRFSQGSIVKEMEKKGLGTRATRAEILQTLYDRKYITGKSISVTKLGEVVTKVLKDYCPRILSEELTRKFEKDTEEVYDGKKKRDQVVKEAENMLTEVLSDFKKSEKKVGKKLLEGLVEARAEERLLGMCPNCKTGELRVMFSRFTKKRFVGCSSYFRCAKCGFTRTACKCKCEICGEPKGKCKHSWKEKKWNPSCQTGFPLPAIGSITSMNKPCEICGLPMIQVWRKGSRPFRMCINNLCKSKESWNKNKAAKTVKASAAVATKEKQTVEKGKEVVEQEKDVVAKVGEVAKKVSKKIKKTPSETSAEKA
jgi:DNA topoisomerase-1